MLKDEHERLKAAHEQRCHKYDTLSHAKTDLERVYQQEKKACSRARYDAKKSASDLLQAEKTLAARQDDINALHIKLDEMRTSLMEARMSAEKNTKVAKTALEENKAYAAKVDTMLREQMAMTTKIENLSGEASAHKLAVQLLQEKVQTTVKTNQDLTEKITRKRRQLEDQDKEIGILKKKYKNISSVNADLRKKLARYEDPDY